MSQDLKVSLNGETYNLKDCESQLHRCGKWTSQFRLVNATTDITVVAEGTTDQVLARIGAERTYGMT